MPQAFERGRVLMVIVVLGAGAQDYFACVDPGLHPQMVEPVVVDDLLEIAFEPVEVAVAELVLPDPLSCLAKPDTTPP